MSNRLVRRFEAALERDFFRLHSAPNDAAWCYCAAWWVPSWDGWGERSAEENRELRAGLCERGEYDGYLIYESGEPLGWCQVGPRDRLTKLTAQLKLERSPATWAITCFFIAPSQRRTGLARELLAGVIADLRARGVARRLEAFPKRGSRLDEGDLWNGPEGLFKSAGFVVVREDSVRPVLALELADAP